MNSDINNIINLNNYYTITDNKPSNQYCIDLTKDQKYQCRPCDNTNRNPLLKLEQIVVLQIYHII